MRFPAIMLATSLGLAIGQWPSFAGAQGDRDYVFTDEEGHLVLRFVGTALGGLNASQIDEVVNVQLSTMVHDRLRADAAFEAERVDSPWALPMEARIEESVAAEAREFSAIHTECRSGSCRLVLEHAGGRTVAEHQALMDSAESAIRSFIERNPLLLERVFLIAAHYQDPESPYINVFLRRAARLEPTGRRASG